MKKMQRIEKNGEKEKNKMNAKLEAKEILRSLFRLPRDHGNSNKSIDEFVDLIIQATKDEIRKVGEPHPNPLG